MFQHILSKQQKSLVMYVCGSNASMHGSQTSKHTVCVKLSGSSGMMIIIYVRKCEERIAACNQMAQGSNAQFSLHGEIIYVTIQRNRNSVYIRIYIHTYYVYNTSAHQSSFPCASHGSLGCMHAR